MTETDLIFDYVFPLLAFLAAIFSAAVAYFNFKAFIKGILDD